jgi:hypothetical protein
MTRNTLSQDNPGTIYKNVKAPDFRTIYSNNVGFTAALFDFGMIFGEVTDVEQTGADVGTITVEQKVRVVMTPLHAKVFLQVAANQLRAYEEKFGELKVPEQLLKTTPLKPATEVESDE